MGVQHSQGCRVLCAIVDTMRTTTCRVGIWLYPDAPATDLVEAVISADRAGVDEMWMADEGVAGRYW